MSEPVLPDFTTMTDEEKVAWVDANLDALIAGGGWTQYPAGRPSFFDRVQGPPPEPEVLQVTTVRLAPALIKELDDKYGNTRGGRAGFIREAIEEKLRREAA